MAGPAGGLVGVHHLVLLPAPVLGVAPQDPVALLGRHQAIELHGVLAAQLLRVSQRPNRRQDSDALIPPVEEVQRGDSYQIHLSFQ